MLRHWLGSPRSWILLSSLLIWPLTTSRALSADPNPTPQPQLGRDLQPKKTQIQLQEEKKQALATALERAHAELKVLHNQRASPEDTKIRIFRLQHITADETIQTLHDILGRDKDLRLSHGSKPHQVILRGNEATLDRADHLIKLIDTSSTNRLRASLPDALTVRVLWIADGNVDAEAQPAGNYLPDAVTEGLQRVGIENPAILLQSNTSAAWDEEGIARFKADGLSALVLGQRLLFRANGKILPAENRQLRLEIQTSTTRSVGTDFFNENFIEGSLVAPLDHFVIVGTASYTSATEQKTKRTHNTSRLAMVVQMTEMNVYQP